MSYHMLLLVVLQMAIISCFAKSINSNHDYLLGKIATIISAQGMTPQNRKVLMELTSIRGIACHAINFQQTIKHNDCKTQTISNKLCFGSCLSKTEPLILGGEINSIAKSCLPGNTIDTAVVFDCGENKKSLKFVKIVQTCNCQNLTANVL